MARLTLNRHRLIHIHNKLAVQAPTAHQEGHQAAMDPALDRATDRRVDPKELIIRVSRCSMGLREGIHRGHQDRMGRGMGHKGDILMGGGREAGSWR